MIELWGFRYSTNADRVTIALAYKGLDYTAHDVPAGDRTEVEALSGQPLVPVLRHDGRVLADSPAILAHLDDRFPDPPLWPADPAQRAQADVFVEWFNRVWKVAPNALADGTGDPAHHAATLARHQDLLDGLLADGREHLLGPFGIADVVAWPFLRYALDAQPGDDDPFHQVLRDHLDLEGRPRLRAWIERVAARPEASRRY